jgi:hypothetical protein
MMWNAVRAEVTGQGGTVRTESEVVAVEREGRHIRGIVVSANGTRETVSGTNFISSMPVTELIARLDPPAPPEVRAAAARLTYRDFLTVCLIVNEPALFPDNWIYVHDPAVRVGRIQNFKNWSPDMVPDRSKTSLGLEYFCDEGDELWRMTDAALVELAKREIARIGLARYEDVEDGCAVRIPKAYPVYDAAYREHLEVVRGFVDALDNLQTIGRNGLHRYNNQDHAMLTGMLAVHNLVHGERNNLWSVNADQEYHEEFSGPEARVLEDTLARVFAKLDRVAFGLALGGVSGLTLFLATLALALKGGPVVRPNLALLAQYFPGYEVTLGGSVLGLGYGLLAGFAVGWSFALARNATAFLYEAAIRRRAESGVLGQFLDHI